MQVYRLQRQRYGLQLSGLGAASSGARWNSPGTEIVYTAGNRSLAMAEVWVHLRLSELPRDFKILTIDIPIAIEIEEISIDSLPPAWNRFPHLPETQCVGDDFIRRSKTPVLKVPSVITPGDSNYLLNPHHGDFHKIVVACAEAFAFDHRLFSTATPN